MKIKFQKDDSELDDFELTDEMKYIVDEAKKQDPSTYQDAFQAVEEIRQKYGI